MGQQLVDAAVQCLNAPYGARCSLTRIMRSLQSSMSIGPNVPYGARCLLAPNDYRHRKFPGLVLMHLMALGAF